MGLPSFCFLFFVILPLFFIYRFLFLFRYSFTFAWDYLLTLRLCKAAKEASSMRTSEEVEELEKLLDHERDHVASLQDEIKVGISDVLLCLFALFCEFICSVFLFS